MDWYLDRCRELEQRPEHHASQIFVRLAAFTITH